MNKQELAKQLKNDARKALLYVTTFLSLASSMNASANSFAGHGNTKYKNKIGVRSTVAALDIFGADAYDDAEKEDTSNWKEDFAYVYGLEQEAKESVRKGTDDFIEINRDINEYTRDWSTAKEFEYAKYRQDKRAADFAKERDKIRKKQTNRRLKEGSPELKVILPAGERSR